MQSILPTSLHLTFTKAQVGLSSPPGNWCGNSSVSISGTVWTQMCLIDFQPQAPNHYHLQHHGLSTAFFGAAVTKETKTGSLEERKGCKKRPRGSRKLSNTALEKNKRKGWKRFYKEKSKARINLNRNRIITSRLLEGIFCTGKDWKPGKDM